MLVMFLKPRKSRIDIAQAVGRVMRKAEGKDYGYVILPIGIPAGVDENSVLNKTKISGSMGCFKCSTLF